MSQKEGGESDILNVKDSTFAKFQNLKLTSLKKAIGHEVLDRIKNTVPNPNINMVYNLIKDERTYGDPDLLNDEYKREIVSRVNYLIIFLLPPMLISIGLCAYSMFTFENVFA
jgi:hypothetical protein